jgi:hypothetical protein
MMTTTSFPLQQPRFDLSSGHVGFVVDKGALGQITSVSFANSQSTNYSTFINHLII